MRPRLALVTTRLPAALALLVLACAAAPAGAQSFVTFESGQVRPLALSPDGTRLFAVNTPDARLEVFGVSGAGLTHLGAVPVGLEPVAVAARNDAETFEAGEPVFRESEPASLLFFLCAGEVVIERDGVVLRAVAAGEFFGVEALYGESIRATTARALTAATVVPVGLHLYARLAAEDPSFAARVRRARLDEEAIVEQTTGARHGRIHDDHMRLQLRHQTNGFIAVAAFADHRDARIVFEQTPESAPHEGVIVNQQDSDFVGHFRVSAHATACALRDARVERRLQPLRTMVPSVARAFLRRRASGIRACR